VIQALRSIYNNALFHVGHRIRSRHVLAQVARHAPDAGRVLDAGSGNGSYSLVIARRFPRLEVEGIEIEPSKVEACTAVARSQGLDNAHFAVGDITRIGRVGRYGLLVSVDVLEHVPDDGAAFRSIAAALAPGGVALLHVPRERPRRFFAALEDHHQDDHVRDGYEPQALAASLREAGFAEVTVRQTFGAAGELAWEVMQLLRRGNPSRARELLGVALSPLLSLLCEIDFRLDGGSKGNGLLVIARRPVVASGDVANSSAGEPGTDLRSAAAS
jgi:SAM-dependent methyltransferase